LLSTDIFIEIENHNRLFSFLNTSKKARKKVKNIMVNLEYDFLSRQIKFNNIVVDNNKVSDQFFTVIEGFNDNGSNNLTKSRRLLNDLLSIYEG
jgi:hypothetical protein